MMIRPCAGQSKGKGLRGLMLAAHRGTLEDRGACTCGFVVRDGSDKATTEDSELFKTNKSLCEAILCAPTTIEGRSHHKWTCVDGQCDDCGGVDGAGNQKLPKLMKFAVCPCVQKMEAVDTTNEVVYSKFKQEGTETRTGAGKLKQKKYKTIVHVSETISTFFTTLTEFLTKSNAGGPAGGGFLVHRHCAKLCAENFDEHIKNLKPGECIMLCDFGMNYSHIHMDETQSEFWCHIQTTVFPVICYYREAADKPVKAYSYCFLSDDTYHSSDFVRYACKSVLGILKTKGINTDRCTIWSDGAKNQFKLNKQFVFISQDTVHLPVMVKDIDNNYTHEKDDQGCFKWVQAAGVRFAHFFFASCHGKGPSDAETAVVKRKARVVEKTQYLAFSFDMFRETRKSLQEDLEPIIAGSARDLQVHSLYTRSVMYVSYDDQVFERAKVVKPKGLEGQVMRNHSFRPYLPAGKPNEIYSPYERRCIAFLAHHHTTVQSKGMDITLDNVKAKAGEEGCLLKRMKEQCKKQEPNLVHSMIPCCCRPCLDNDGGNNELCVYAAWHEARAVACLRNDGYASEYVNMTERLTILARNKLIYNPENIPESELKAAGVAKHIIPVMDPPLYSNLKNYNLKKEVNPCPFTLGLIMSVPRTMRDDEAVTGHTSSSDDTNMVIDVKLFTKIDISATENPNNDIFKFRAGAVDMKDSEAMSTWITVTIPLSRCVLPLIKNTSSAGTVNRRAGLARPDVDSDTYRLSPAHVEGVRVLLVDEQRDLTVKPPIDHL